MALFILESELALIGYRWPDAPKIVFECSFVERVALWKEGYSVDAIPISEAVKIKEDLDNAQIERSRARLTCTDGNYGK